MVTPDPAAPSASAEDRALDALVGVIQAAAGPAAQEAQALLLRRLALEGDVIPSRVPAPLDITQVGGYLNLLTDLGQQRTTLQVLTSALGVAGQGSVLTDQSLAPLTFSAMPNDRPTGAAGPTATSTVLVRSDLVPGLQSVLAAVHHVGAILPLWTSPAPVALTAAAGNLEVCGRQLRVLPAAALSDPTTDSLVLARPIGTPATTTYDLYARPDPANAATSSLPETQLGGAVLDAATGKPLEVDLGLVRLLSLRPVLMAAGWTTAPVAALPTGLADLTWSQLLNISGLLRGVTRLGDELALVRTPDEIDGTPFADRIDWVWNGTDFAPLGS
jgi:hypothetical protein